MSSTTLPTTLPETAPSRLLFGKAAGGIKLAAYTLFGCLLLLDSLYLIICYITFDFFGAFNSPFFGWMRTGAFVAQVMYFPLLLAGLLSVDMGQTARAKHTCQAVAAILMVLQLGAGFLFYFFSPGAVCLFGWALVYGPHLHSPLGEVGTYAEGLACLVPLGWISVLHIATSFRVAGARRVSNRLRLGPFLVAATATSLLYEGTAALRLVRNGVQVPFATLGFVMAACLVVFLGAFLVLEWIRVLANRFSNPGLAQFAVRCASAWIVLALVLRKMVFALLAFNDSRADWYAAALGFALVIFPAALILKVRQLHQEPTQDKGRTRIWAVRCCVFAGSITVFYVSAIKFMSIDWAHVIGSLGALLTAGGLLWFCVALRRAERNYAPAFLALLSVACVAGAGAIKRGVMRGHLADSLEEYGDYDAAAFVIQHAFKPAMEEGKYAAWYDFLSRHANIRPAVSAPYVPLVADLKPAKGRRPHIFFFVIDALRRDYVSAYNPAVNFTPHLDTFAKESVVFQHAYSPYAGTALAVPAMWSGFHQINKTFASPLSRENNLEPMLAADDYDCYISYNTIVRFLSTESHGVTPLQTDESNQLDFGPIAEELENDLVRRKDRDRPIFAFAQPTNVHSLWLAWHGGKTEVRPHFGFNDTYASGVERVDETFGKFIDFLKQQGLYDDSIVIVTADHGESLGEMGRESHVTNVTPEVIDVPLLIHLPEWEKSKMVWDTQAVVTLHDLTPTLYYLLGHRPLNSGELLGRPLFTFTMGEQQTMHPDHYFLMSSYGAVFGVLSADQKSLFMVDAIQHRNYYYDLANDPRALKNKVTSEIRDHFEPLIRADLEKIDRLYEVSEQELGR